MAEELNKFFASVFTQENIETVPALEPETASQFNNIEITEEKIRIKIKQLKENGAPGPDEIGVKILKLALNHLVQPVPTTLPHF